MAPRWHAANFKNAADPQRESRRRSHHASNPISVAGSTLQKGYRARYKGGRVRANRPVLTRVRARSVSPYSSRAAIDNVDRLYHGAHAREKLVIVGGVFARQQLWLTKQRPPRRQRRCHGVGFRTGLWIRTISLTHDGYTSLSLSKKSRCLPTEL
jgi:hypothetical protein